LTNIWEFKKEEEIRNRKKNQWKKPTRRSWRGEMAKRGGKRGEKTKAEGPQGRGGPRWETIKQREECVEGSSSQTK